MKWNLNKLFIGWIVLIGSFTLYGYEPPAKLLHGMEKITAKKILEDVTELSSPKLKGRLAGKAGAREAAAFIAKEFKAARLRPGGSAGTFFQSFKIKKGYIIQSKLDYKNKVGKKVSLRRNRDYTILHFPADTSEITAKVDFFGYGILSKKLKYNDYSDVSALGKMAFVFSGTPWSAETLSWLKNIDSKDYANIQVKAKTAHKNGAKALIVVENPLAVRSRLSTKAQLALPDKEFPLDSPIPVIQMTRKAFMKMTGLKREQLRVYSNDLIRQKKSKPISMDGGSLTFQASLSGKARIGKNVIGIIPGSDPKLRDEAVVIGAHYDHLGEEVDEIYAGANDNASGVAGLLSIARAMTSQPEMTKRSIVFIAFAAEEIGKLGSYYYTSRPSIPISNTVFMINFDMIGRNHENEVMAVGTRSSDELHSIHKMVNKVVGLNISNPRNLRLGRSDHTAFYEAGIPIMYLFGGLHIGYHTPQDTVDKIVPKKIERIARLAYLTALEVSNRKKRIEFTAAE